MEYEVRRIPILPAIKVLFFVYLAIGFAGGIFYGMIVMNLLSVMRSAIDLGDEVFQEFSSMGGVGIIMIGIMMSLFSCVLLSGLTALALATYNMAAGWLGGIKLDIESPELDEILYEEADDNE